VASLIRATDGKVLSALDALFEARLSTLDVPVLDVLDAERCPLAMLPWLAWHYGLLHFDSRWPASVQREVVRQARLILRERGTRRGMLRALEAYGARVDVLERAQDAALEHGTFEVRVARLDPINDDADEQREIDRAIRRSAPLTRPWVLTVGARESWAHGVASAARVAVLIEVEGVSVG
jgi:phage tail P2-like protein